MTGFNGKKFNYERARTSSARTTTMKATIESTNYTLVLNGLAFRVWEGTTEKGVPFIALVNRLQGTDRDKQAALIQEIMVKSKDPEASTAPALEMLGVYQSPGEKTASA